MDWLLWHFTFNMAFMIPDGMNPSDVDDPRPLHQHQNEADIFEFQ